MVVVAPVLFGLVITRASAAVGLAHIFVVASFLASAMAVLMLMLLKVTARSLDHAQAELEFSRTQMQSPFEQAPEGIFVADLEGRYVDVNEAGCRAVTSARRSARCPGPTSPRRRSRGCRRW